MSYFTKISCLFSKRKLFKQDPGQILPVIIFFPLPQQGLGLSHFIMRPKVYTQYKCFEAGWHMPEIPPPGRVPDSLSSKCETPPQK